MDYVWILLKCDGECSSILEGVFLTKKTAEDRKTLLLSKVEKSERDFIGFEIEKWPIHEEASLFYKGEKE